MKIRFLADTFPTFPRGRIEICVSNRFRSRNPVLRNFRNVVVEPLDTLQQALLLGNGTFGVNLKTLGSRFERSRKCRPFNQHTKCIGQILARGRCIGGFSKEADSRVFSGPGAPALVEYGAFAPDFKRFGPFEERFDQQLAFAVGLAEFVERRFVVCNQLRKGHQVANDFREQGGARTAVGEGSIRSRRQSLRGWNGALSRLLSRGGKAKAENLSSRSRR